MATAKAYFSQSVGNLNNPYATIAQIISQLGGLKSPVQDPGYTAPDRIDVIDPKIRTIAQYLSEVGAEDYQYNYEDILNLLNNSTEVAQAAQQEKLRQADAAYKQAVAENQDSALDTIRQQYAQGIQNGINKGMAAANQLSAILSTSKENAKTAQENAEARVNAANEYYADLAKNGVTALDKSNAAMETLMGNIRQLYNDEIQQRTSELEYNASIEETLANYLVNKYAADLGYANNVNTQAADIYNNNQSSLASLINAAIGAEAQDNYSGAYRDAAQIQADAQVKAADIAAQAQLEAQRLSLQAAQAQAAANAARYAAGSGGGGSVTIKGSTPPTSGTSGNTRKASANTYRGYAPYASQVHSNTKPTSTYRGYAPYASQVHINTKPTATYSDYAPYAGATRAVNQMLSNTKPTPYAGATRAVNQMQSNANKNSRTQSRR